MTGRQAYTIDQLKAMLVDRLPAVLDTYAPSAKGSYRHGGRYFTLNPGRADRNVGSFYVHELGDRAGKWTDHATGQFGDVLDLIALKLACSPTEAIREARAFLGLETESPETRRLRERAAADGARRRAEAEKSRRHDQARKRRQAFAMWLSGQEKIAGTPVEAYLRDQRGIDLALLGRQPGVLRYHPACFYSHTDKETGEVIEGTWPAMLALMTNLAGKPVAVHRTWLARGADGRWSKAPVPEPKKVLGYDPGFAIHLSRGADTGPRGGRAPALRDAPPGTHVYISEGIEDALSAMILLPEARVLAAYSLGNLGMVKLPPTVTKVTLIADRDASEEAQATLVRAIAAHRAAGRRVAVWQNPWGGKDLNDALRAALATAQEGAA
jgi:hypothetical protein